MRIVLEFQGVTPLLCHNKQLSDPLNPIAKEIRTFTRKRTKTDEDWEAIARLEWYGGLYIENGNIVVPTANIKKALIEGGKITKQGKNIGRATQFTDLFIPLIHDGPDDLKAMYADPRFVDRDSVRIGTSRTMRVRPKFVVWKIVTMLELLESVMNLEDFVNIAEQTGMAEGLGDNRANGYGRFAVKVKQAN